MRALYWIADFVEAYYRVHRKLCNVQALPDGRWRVVIESGREWVSTGPYTRSDLESLTAELNRGEALEAAAG
jgi:hypothetical protein